jgi:hypothetical protein
MKETDLGVLLHSFENGLRIEPIKTRLDDLFDDTTSQELELYSELYKDAAMIIRAVGRTKSSKKESLSNRDHAKYLGNLQYTSIDGSRPVNMGVMSAKGRELMGRVVIQKPMVRPSERRFQRFKPADGNVGNVVVSLFTYGERMDEHTLFWATAQGDSERASAFVRNETFLRNEFMTPLQAMEEVASSIMLIRERV